MRASIAPAAAGAALALLCAIPSGAGAEKLSDNPDGQST